MLINECTRARKTKAVLIKIDTIIFFVQEITFIFINFEMGCSYLVHFENTVW